MRKTPSALPNHGVHEVPMVYVRQGERFHHASEGLRCELPEPRLEETRHRLEDVDATSATDLFRSRPQDSGYLLRLVLRKIHGGHLQQRGEEPRSRGRDEFCVSPKNVRHVLRQQLGPALDHHFRDTLEEPLVRQADRGIRPNNVRELVRLEGPDEGLAARGGGERSEQRRFLAPHTRECPSGVGDALWRHGGRGRRDLRRETRKDALVVGLHRGQRPHDRGQALGTKLALVACEDVVRHAFDEETWVKGQLREGPQHIRQLKRLQLVQTLRRNIGRHLERRLMVQPQRSARPTYNAQAPHL
mmetsp:Transcript_111549/g.314975  ORF Transcript_111549/g.314975 Transcript_111549/m.314975 type:complete len:302 (-) Transcript_111549:418-1323(-)